MTNKISYLDDGELCVLTKDDVSFYDATLRNKEFTMSENENSTDKGGKTFYA